MKVRNVEKDASHERQSQTYRTHLQVIARHLRFKERTCRNLLLKAPMTPPYAPTPQALRLGYAGLLPFLAGAVAIAVSDGSERSQVGWALLAYGATIASFLGGIHWGAAMQRGMHAPKALAWGVMPQLIGWLSLLLPLRAGLLVAGSLLLLCYAVDRTLYPQAGLAGWLPLRLPLSVGAGLCCLSAACFS
jgi:Protein of unknown function (DUF3429)